MNKVVVSVWIKALPTIRDLMRPNARNTSLYSRKGLNQA